MTKCICIPKKQHIPEVGSMNNYVKFQERTITEPDTSGTGYSYGEQLSNTRNFWVNFQSIKGINIFDDRNIEDRPTHTIWMRYIPDYKIETGIWVEYKGNYYKILRVSEVYIEDEFIYIELKFLGNTADAINLA